MELHHRKVEFLCQHLGMTLYIHTIQFIVTSHLCTDPGALGEATSKLFLFSLFFIFFCLLNRIEFILLATLFFMFLLFYLYFFFNFPFFSICGRTFTHNFAIFFGFFGIALLSCSSLVTKDGCLIIANSSCHYKTFN